MKFNSTEHPVSWFRDRYNDGSLELKPPFQRKPVWAAKQKSFLIESILLNIPVPEVYIQHSIVDDKSNFAVVDGQQRIRTLLQFLGADTDESEQEYNKFPLDKLPADSIFKDKTYLELTPVEKSSFLGYKLAVRNLDSDNEAAVKDIFRRLNRFLTKLNEQELRNATFSGPFIHQAADLADDPFWTDNRLVSLALVRRMKDVEFVSDLLIGTLHGPQGGSPKVIDEYYNQYEDYEDDFPGQRAGVKRFKRALKLIHDLYPTTENTRWRNRTDFYTLFVAIAVLLITKEPPSKFGPMRAALSSFATDVDVRLADESKKAPSGVVSYVRAVEKGANDKKRRADRHTAITEVIETFFVKRSKTS